jgi:hypothetical protein
MRNEQDKAMNISNALLIPNVPVQATSLNLPKKSV